MSKEQKKFVSREISWLYFNERVLQEASDLNNPLNERIKFLGIFSNNLDEFFRVRVATLNRMLDLKDKDTEYDDFSPKKILKQINIIVSEQQEKFNAVYKDILKNLELNNIFIINEKELSETQGEYVKKYFRDKVRPNLFPIMLSNLDNTDSLKDTAIYLAVHMQKKDVSIKDNFALMKVPSGSIGRFIVLPKIEEKKYVILLDDVIRYCLEDIFLMFDYDYFKAYTIKFTRDAELDLDNDVSKSYIELIEEGLKQRKLGRPVRFIYDKDIPADLLKALAKKFDISSKENHIAGDRYHNFKDFMNFPNLGSKEFEFLLTPPLPHKSLANAKSIFAALRHKDIMLHYPYHSFQYIIDLLRESSIDPNVKSIKMTIYRLARNSNVINALINAARNGKSVTVYLELQARFDEQANLFWSEKLQEEGVKIITGIPGLKVHCKLLLIKRKEGDNSIYYTNVATGNFNEDTAKIYADDSLLTANQKIGMEAEKVFSMFESKYKPFRFSTLIVSPYSQRNFFIRMINNEIANAKAGKKARIIIKLNNLVDQIIAKKLYQASDAGVKIRLIIRGICVLKPRVKGLSENIRAISIVDKFLEHSRLFYFYNNGKENLYISSADWMTRNFDYRIEVGCPINDKEIKSELLKMIDIQLNDNVKARIIAGDSTNEYKKNETETLVRSQMEIYNYFKEMSV
jgi:polyphosphate kinase